MVTPYALLAQRYLWEHGASEHDLAEVALITRRHALLNDNAQMRKPMSLEDYLASRMIATPLRLFDCSQVSDGGGALILMSRERALARGLKPVSIRSMAMRSTHNSVAQTPDLQDLGMAAAGVDAFEAAGLGPQDFQVALLHDAFTISVLITLEALGFAPALAARIVQLARLPHGLLLVTGPTGSGKTTTLYAALAETMRPDEKLVTIEDPVEYRLAGVVQIPVNEKKGLTFARGLRSVLRHDPDRVMVGEIRDAETAQIAVQAALTGHLVFSSVHANHALDVLGRFLHMGLDAWQVVGALEAVLAQRLLRVRCTACGGRGCIACAGTGWRGRRAIAELLRLDDELRDLLVARAPLVRLKQALAERGHQTLRDAAHAALAEGWTTADEVARVTADV
jgi:Tfp pilus assembly pilus retraction ATPase PilT